MNLEKFIELVFNNPENISIEYSNINGEERLIVNGEDLSGCGGSFDDQETLKLVADYKESIAQLDDCIFVEMLDEVANVIDLHELDSLLNQEHFTEEEAEIVEGQINYMKTIIHEKIAEKVQGLIELLEKF